MIIVMLITVALAAALIFVNMVEKRFNEESGNGIKKTVRKKRRKKKSSYYRINENENSVIAVEESIEDDEMKDKEEIFMDNARIVRIRDYISDIEIELKYAGEDNFTHSIIYSFDEAYLRLGTVLKLKNVHENLKNKGYKLKIWDAFRPVEAQFKLWEVYPDDTFVANPEIGYSDHSRGNTVDVTLVHADGSYVEMPSEFDDFSEKAKRDYDGGSELQRSNNLILETEMVNQGFIPYKNEWWHYTDEDEYPVEKNLKIQ